MKELRLSEMLKMESEFRDEGINIHLSESMTDEERERVLGEIQMALYLLKAEEFGYATGGIFKAEGVTPISKVKKEN